uniref:Uncharacterized protein n=1 Tax=Rhizophora mucronata TaxID=61149 RepID=A0A2P2QHA2_RHIMU
MLNFLLLPKTHTIKSRAFCSRQPHFFPHLKAKNASFHCVFSSQIAEQTKF